MRGPTGPRGDIHEGGKRMRTKVLLAAAFATLLCSLVAASSLLASTTRAGATRPASSAVMAAGQNSAIAQATRALSPLAWIPAAPYPTSIVRYAFAQVDENLYVIGGVSDGSVVSAVNVYNATTNTWSPLAPIPVASEGPAGAYLNGKIYVADGLGSAAMHIYDVAGNSWTTGASRPSGDSYGAAAGAYNGKVYVVGGSGSGPTSTLDIYDIATDSWTSGPSAPAPYLLGGYHQVGQYLYIIGSFGAGGPGLNSNVSMRLDMATNTWTTGPTWTPNRADFGLALGGTKLYALGGDTSGGGYFDPSSQVDELDISTWPAGTWTASPPNLASARQANQAGFTSTGRAGGEIWSTGGLAPGFVFIPEHTYRVLPAPPPPPPPPPAPPVRCTVPRVIGMTLSRAKARIRARHCSVGRIRRARSNRVGRVIGQSPRPGSVRAQGFRVRLVVGRSAGGLGPAFVG